LVLAGKKVLTNFTWKNKRAEDHGVRKKEAKKDVSLGLRNYPKVGTCKGTQRSSVGAARGERAS